MAKPNYRPAVGFHHPDNADEEDRQQGESIKGRLILFICSGA
jgi:hypothetical protein